MHGDAESVPYPDESFDFAISEYGAATWCDPEVWVPEAYRLLRPGGALTFLGNHTFTAVCTPSSGANCDERLHFPYFGMNKRDWRFAEIDPGGTDFNLTISDWLGLFRLTGFDVLDYDELQAPPDISEAPFIRLRRMGTPLAVGAGLATLQEPVGVWTEPLHRCDRRATRA